MAEDIPVTEPAGSPPRPVYEAGWPQYGVGYAAIPPAAARRVSWGAIFAGVVVALVIELVLGTLGLAVFLGNLDPATRESTFQGMGVGTGIWLAFTALLGMFVGGWTAGRLAGQPGRFDGAMHGIVTWGLVTLFSTWLATNFVANVVSGAFGLVGSTLGLVGEGVSAVAPAVGQQLQQQGITSENMGNEVERFLRQTGDPKLQPEALRQRAQAAGRELGQAATGENAFDAIAAALGRLAAQGQAVVNEVDRQDAVNVIVARTDLSEAEASALVDRWVQNWNNLRAQVGSAGRQVSETAAQVTENVTDAVGTFLAWSFVAMAIGLAAAGAGGAVGAPREVPVAPFATREQ